MHTLRNVEASIRTQLVDQRDSLERSLEEVARRSEESAFRRAEELFAPQTRDLRARLEVEVGSLSRRIEEVFTICQQENSVLRGRFEESVGSLDAEVTSLHAELQHFRNLSTVQEKAIKRLEESPEALRTELSELREEFRRESTNLCKELENETRRAEAREASNNWMMQERIDKSVQLVHAVDQRAREQASEAMHNVASIEKHMLFHVDETRELVAKEARELLKDANAGERPDVLELKASMEEKLQECRGNIEVRAAAVESQLRVELATAVGDALQRCERTSDLRMAEVSMGLSEGLEAARRDLRSQAAKQEDMSERWKEQLQEAVDRLDSVAAAARLASEQVHLHASKQLALATAQLRDDLSKEWKSLQEDVAVFRRELEGKASLTELSEQCNATKVSAESASKAVSSLEAHYDGIKAWLERETRSLSERCQSAQNEASEAKQRLHRDHTALGNELARTRTATSSLTQGVLRALQILGLLNEVPQPRDPSRSARFGIDVEDLVEWEKAGRSLAHRVTDQWRFSAPGNVATLLELVAQKADHSDVKMMRQQYYYSEGRRSKTPSTAAGFGDSPSPAVSPDLGRRSAEGWASLPAVSPSPDSFGRTSAEGIVADGFVSPLSPPNNFFRPGGTTPSSVSRNDLFQARPFSSLS